jgi:NADH-quinone oxidoreductase subunit M
MIEQHLLTLTIWTPILGALLVTAAPKTAARWIAAVTTFVVMVLSILVTRRFDPAITDMQLTERYTWIQAFGIQYYLGVDGISITMVLLTGILSFICILASWGFDHWNTTRGEKGYFALFLLLEAGMMGVFESLDFFLFYVFWEMMLLPMYFLIGIWGGPRREYAAIKFFIYTLAGSVLMLVVMIAMYFTAKSGGYPATFDLVELSKIGPKLFTGKLWMLAFLGLYIGFAIKVPVFPFHTWLPDAHVEAPTPISVILAGVLLKMGTYGLMRISYPILPEAALSFAPVMLAFGAWNVIYGSMCAMAQIKGVPRVNDKGERIVERDLKKMIAYSSVAHMGFCLLGLAAATPAGLSGCLMQMWNHGTITSMLFLLVGVIYDRAHHRNIDGFGGLWTQMPHFASMTALAFMASLGLPGLSGFVGEFLSFAGAFQGGSDTYFINIGSWAINSSRYFKTVTAISVVGVVLGAGYFLWSFQRVFQGPLNPKYKDLPDMNAREIATIWPLAIITVVLGVYPALYLDLIQPAMTKLSEHMAMPWVTGALR